MNLCPSCQKRCFVTTNLSLHLKFGLVTLRVQESNSLNSQLSKEVIWKSGIPTHFRGSSAPGHPGEPHRFAPGARQLLMGSVSRWPLVLLGTPGGVWVQQTMDRPEPERERETEMGITKPGSCRPRISSETMNKDGKLVTTQERNVLTPPSRQWRR